MELEFYRYLPVIGFVLTWYKNSSGCHACIVPFIVRTLLQRCLRRLDACDKPVSVRVVRIDREQKKDTTVSR